MNQEQVENGRGRRSTDQFDISMMRGEVPEVRRRWSTVFLVAGSALLGATAIAFLNRRTIASLRSRLSSEQSTPSARTDDEII